MDRRYSRGSTYLELRLHRVMVKEWLGATTCARHMEPDCSAGNIIKKVISEKRFWDPGARLEMEWWDPGNFLACLPFRGPIWWPDWIQGKAGEPEQGKESGRYDPKLKPLISLSQLQHIAALSPPLSTTTPLSITTSVLSALPSFDLHPLVSSQKLRSPRTIMSRPAAQQQSQGEAASPIGIANLPNQRHKIVAKRGAAFTIMVWHFQKPPITVVLADHMTRSLANLDWAKPPLSTPSSQPPSRTTKTTRDDMQSKSIRPSRLRSQRPSWKRSFSKVELPTKHVPQASSDSFF